MKSGASPRTVDSLQSNARPPQPPAVGGVMWLVVGREVVLKPCTAAVGSKIDEKLNGDLNGTDLCVEAVRVHVRPGVVRPVRCACRRWRRWRWHRRWLGRQPPRRVVQGLLRPLNGLLVPPRGREERSHPNPLLRHVLRGRPKQAPPHGQRARGVAGGVEGVGHPHEQAGDDVVVRVLTHEQRKAWHLQVVFVIVVVIVIVVVVVVVMTAKMRARADGKDGERINGGEGGEG